MAGADSTPAENPIRAVQRCARYKRARSRSTEHQSVTASTAG
jgi:hypothetical protein